MMRSNMSDSLLVRLEDGLFRLGDLQTIRNRIVSERDISSNFALLSQTTASVDAIEHVVAIYFNACQKRLRFQRKKGLIAMKRLIKNRRGGGNLSPLTVNQLFYIFQLFFCDKSDATQWAVTTMLKDQVLNSEQLSWLIANCDRSVHALNRLLRHPTVPPMLSTWAQQCIADRVYQNRLSELLALSISSETDINALCRTHGGDRVAWGIFYCRLQLSAKKALLSRASLVKDSIQSFVEICVKLDLRDVLKARLASLRS